jgi:hypothetical protein
MELLIDILREILKRVSLDDFGQLRCVSKQFNELCSVRSNAEYRDA